MGPGQTVCSAVVKRLIKQNNLGDARKLGCRLIYLTCLGLPIRRQSFRDVAVDIHALETGGYNIGYITLGEYLRYTVVVTGNCE